MHNARVVAGAERYYRIMYYGSAQSWNLRDQHMFETLGELLRARGPQAKGVVWAHNSHLGDARYVALGFDGPMKIKDVRPSHAESYERQCHEADVPSFLLPLDKEEELQRQLLEPRLERAIGVIYRPDTELAHERGAAARHRTLEGNARDVPVRPLMEWILRAEGGQP